MRKVTINRKCVICVLMLFIASSLFAQVKENKVKKARDKDACFVKVRKPGELKQRIPEKMIMAIRILKVEGNINSQDVKFLKYLASRTTIKDTL